MQLPSHIFSAAILISLMPACHSSRPVQSEGTCTSRGILLDRSGLDGCGFLILTDDGRMLLPTSWPDENFKPRDLQDIRFSYEPADAMGSICMAEDEIVQVTCLTQAIPKPIDCVDALELDDAPFLVKARERHRPQEIVKYRYRTDGWMYLLRGEKVYLYDCQGTLICVQDELTARDCAGMADPGAEGLTIWRMP